jgi:hypothetical protein
MNGPYVITDATVSSDKNIYFFFNGKAKAVIESRIFPFVTASRTALGTTQPPIQRVPGALSLGIKRPVREADHSPPSSAEVKE